MSWTVTYRVRLQGGGPPRHAEHAETLTAAWCDGAGYDPGDVESAEGAAWAVALLAGAHGDDDAELISVTWDETQ